MVVQTDWENEEASGRSCSTALSAWAWTEALEKAGAVDGDEVRIVGRRVRVRVRDERREDMFEELDI